ncbi:MAG: Crp/Fnr family transcriptional regulator [Gammaproteobacteria bacterium]
MAIEDTALFPELGREDIDVLSKAGTLKSFPRNTLLISEGDPSNELYIIVAGKVRVYASEADGKEVTLSLEGPGQYFGELGLIDDAPRSASVVTTEPSKLVVLTKNDFQRCLGEHPAIALKLLHFLVQQVRTLTERLKNIALLDVYGRISRTFMSMACEREGHWVIEQRLTQQEVANLVGCAREMVARVMKDLVTGGYIEVEHKCITIKKKLPAAW